MKTPFSFQKRIIVKRIMTGMRPTGDLHLGHLFGVLEQTVALQEQGQVFIEIADLHAYTTGYADPSKIHDSVLSLVMDYLAAGIDPYNHVIFLQSAVPEIAEMHALLSMVVPVPFLERQPTYKSHVAALQGEDRASYGFLGYPLLQACDMLAFDATHVPIGEDQLPHLELASDIVRRFNHLYGEGHAVLRAPEPMLSEAPLVPGTDARKMSKSYDNTLPLGAHDDETVEKIKNAYTDPTKVRKTDPGHPEGCPVFAYRKLAAPDTADEIASVCRAGGLGCVADKAETARLVNERLRSFRAKRADLSTDPMRAQVALRMGTDRARSIARYNLDKIRRAMRLFEF